jgi:rubrerythrin
MAETTVLEDAKNVFQNLMAQRSVVATWKKDLDGYEHAMKIEAESVKFYEGMARKEQNEVTAKLLQKIADEEKKHFEIMENLYDFVLAPQNYLAWGEFSIKEF